MDGDEGMNVGFSLQQEQVQKLIMTPELRQAISILQFSAQELLTYIENEMQSNPVIEWDEAIPNTSESVWDWSAIAKTQRVDRSEMQGRGMKEDHSLLEQQTKYGITLAEHLLQQLMLVICDQNTRIVSQYIIHSLNENGYLYLGNEELAELCGTTHDVIERAVELVQTFEPTGVAARSLQECLLIQVRQLRIDTQTQMFLEQIIHNHLQDVAEGRWNRISQALQLSLQDVQHLTDKIKTLDPKPGRAFSDIRPAYVIPDVTVERVANQYVVLVNDRLAPHLKINNMYRKLIEAPEITDAKEFINKKLTSAMSLIKSIEQRRQTMYNVTKAIIDVQGDFLEYGITHLKPMTMKQIAELVGVHESTVSRAVNDKYVQTPRGVFELKFFFTSGIKMENGSGNSAESIKVQIKQLIEREDSKKPYSDQKLADLLAAMGIPISRRTVTKYREELGIHATAQRKRFG